MCHCVSTASSWRVYGTCTAFALSDIVSIALSQILQGAATAIIALPRRSHYGHRCLQLRCEQTQRNGINADSSLPPSLCVQAVSTSSLLLNASNPGYSLPNMHVQQVKEFFFTWDFSSYITKLSFSPKESLPAS